MSQTFFGTNSPHTRKLWSDRMYTDNFSDESLLGMLKNLGVLVEAKELGRAAGDQVKYQLLARNQEVGLVGMQAAQGNESALLYYPDSMIIDQIRHSINNPATGTIDAQRVNFDLMEDAYKVLGNWMKERKIVSFFNQVVGNDATSIVWDNRTYAGDPLRIVTGCNPVSAPTANRVYRVNGGATDAVTNLDTTAKMSFAVVDDLELMASIRTGDGTYLDPIENQGGVKYLLFVHPIGFKQLIQDVTAPHTFRDIQQARIAAGTVKDGLFGREMVYSQTRIIATDKLPNGVNAGTVQANTRRAAFLGKNAATIAMGKGYDGSKGYSFKTDTIDIGNRDRLAVSFVGGIKKNTFRSEDLGVFAVTHYAA